MDAKPTFLSVQGLVARCASEASPSTACVDGVSFELERGRVLALVGPSGSGKSMTGLSIMRLLPAAARQIAGRILFEGRDLSALSAPDLQRVRGRQIAMLFQEPATALSPVHTIGWQLGVALAATGQLDRGLLARRRQARERACALLARVDLPEPVRLLDMYAHQLSAGMRRRVALALALAGRPALLIADEPTTGLDVTLQAQIIELLARLVREQGLGVLLITHDLGAVRALADDVAVMVAGQVVETGPAADVLARPQHPYTRALLASARRLTRLDGATPPAAEVERSAAPATPDERRREPRPALAQDTSIGGGLDIEEGARSERSAHASERARVVEALSLGAHGRPDHAIEAASFDGPLAFGQREEP